MMQSLPALPFPSRLFATRMATRQPWLWAGALLLASLLLLATMPSYAIDLVNLGAIGGPLGSALNTLGTLTPGVKARKGAPSAARGQEGRPPSGRQGEGLYPKGRLLRSLCAKQPRQRVEGLRERR